MSLTESILEGNRLALARLLTQVENESPEGRTALAELFPHTGKAHLIGVTGAPGTGKSSLVNQLALHYRRNEEGRHHCRRSLESVHRRSGVRRSRSDARPFWR
jgi:LAO/AO transport system kinase